MIFIYPTTTVPRSRRFVAMANSIRRFALATLLLHCLLAVTTVVESLDCPKDSEPTDDGRCKCLPYCPLHDCQPGQQPVPVREAIPERPGSCCPLYECRNQATLSYIPEDTGNQCVDTQGKPRENGEVWQEADPCVRCTCELGTLSCQSTMCRSCTRTLPRLPGECCPKCQPPLPPATKEPCLPLNDCKLECELGFDADASGCSVCRCRSQEQNEVDERREKDRGEEEESESRICPRLENCEVQCEHGYLLDERGCATCQCRPQPGCPPSPPCQRKCPQGYRTNKRGCPICRCLGSCLDERNVTRPEGSLWSIEPCRSCVCKLGGEISCNETICSVACSDPLSPPPGHCCPVCPTSAANDASRDWYTISIVLIVVLGLLCTLLLVPALRGRFRARLAPSEADFAGYPQYYKCVPVYETHVPVLRHAEKIVPL